MIHSGVRFLPCGEFVNESERIAVERLCSKLQGAETPWILLSNLNHSPYLTSRSDEIDLVAIGAPGVCVIEIKHWDTAWLKQQSLTVEQEAERINAKAKRVAGKLRQRLDPGFVTARLLLTRGELRFEAGKRPQPRGVAVFGLSEWRELLALDGPTRLTPDQIERAAKLLEPAAKVALNGELRAFAGLINLERLSDQADAFHRIYRGQHPTRRDRVILHLYDLSASADKQAFDLARREFETLQRWQKSPFVPSLLDSFQDVDGYPGELYFFSLVDPAAPTLIQRGQDSAWDIPARLAYAREALLALDRFHHPDDPAQPSLLHRRLTPASLRVRHNGQPLFTDFSLSRLADAQSISAVAVDFGALTPYVAPEIQQGGLVAATVHSDTYALCASLATLFEAEEPLAQPARAILADGDAALRAYRKVRAHTTHPNLSVIHEIAPEWRPNGFVALMRWVEGMPLQDLSGVLPLHAEDLGEPSADSLALRWLTDLCAALGELHRASLVHGDVSPRNIIVQAGTVVLTDYDKVTEAGGPSRGGTPGYASPSVQNHSAIHPSDDVYALAASFFHVLHDRDPFPQGQEHGLDWEGTSGYEPLRPFLERATHPRPEERFADALAARQGLLKLRADLENVGEVAGPPEPPPPLTPNTAPWLGNLLSAYPGSRHGNSETRGLDSEFALLTYVETRLDSALLAEIKTGQINLAILFGNAGDGKTAFLQHLARQLGIMDVHSSRRVWEYPLADGRMLRVNLDGSAAWRDRSANELLDELFRPFQQADYSRQ
ncbi:MAG: hypothetical protein H6R23_2940, partial [Proteobacteria bacterium]|nr:hypothetical protein [Pseudomonadota bacterium]